MSMKTQPKRLLNLLRRRRRKSFTIRTIRSPAVTTPTPQMTKASLKLQPRPQPDLRRPYNLASPNLQRLSTQTSADHRRILAPSSQAAPKSHPTSTSTKARASITSHRALHQTSYQVCPRGISNHQWWEPSAEPRDGQHKVGRDPARLNLREEDTRR